MFVKRRKEYAFYEVQIGAELRMKSRSYIHVVFLE